MSCMHTFAYVCTHLPQAPDCCLGVRGGMAAKPWRGQVSIDLCTRLHQATGCCLDRAG
jgi:hypothetical protein